MKTNSLIITLCLVFIGGVVGLIFWIKKNASTILADTASKTITEVTNNNEVSLKEQLRNTTAQTLSAATGGITNSVQQKTQNLFNKWLKVN